MFMQNLSIWLAPFCSVLFLFILIPPFFLLRDSSALLLSLKIRAEFELMGFSEYKIW